MPTDTPGKFGYFVASAIIFVIAFAVAKQGLDRRMSRSLPTEVERRSDEYQQQAPRLAP